MRGGRGKGEKGTCHSVEYLRFKEYAGVLVPDTGQEQTLGLSGTSRYYHLTGGIG